MARLYHIDRVKSRLKAGQVLGLIHDKSSISATTDRARQYVEMFPDGVTYHGWNYLINENRPTPSRDTLGIIEILAEQIRQTRYKNRISRFQSIFAFRIIEDAQQFIALYPVTVSDGVQLNQGAIWEVEGEVAFQSDMHRLNLGECWLDALININAYWQGRDSNLPLREVLLRPPVKVIRKIKVIG